MLDEVDAIAAAWQAERPDLELAPIQVLSRISRIARLLDDRRSQAFAEHGLAAHEFDVLAAIRRAGTPYEQTPGQLIEATHVTSGTMTNRLDRLAARRLIVRREHPADGRQVIIRLTPAGRRRVDAAFEALLASEEALLSGLPTGQRASLAAGLRRLLGLATGPGNTAGPGHTAGPDRSVGTAG
jgi:DNA-binding MarR family transcriptional regulator